MDTEINLTRPTAHPQEVKKYIKEERLNEEQARQSVYKDLRVSRLERDVKKLKEQSLIDPLTGLLNRRAFDGDLNANPKIVGELTRLFEQTNRSGQPITLLMIDLDKFKEYNDLYGHPVGDEALRILSKIISGVIRKTDLAFRYGGEEFSVLLPSTDHSVAINLAERLRKAVYLSIDFKERVSISIGVADYPNSKHGIITAKDLVDAADRSLYQAKEKGRNQTVSIL